MSWMYRAKVKLARTVGDPIWNRSRQRAADKRRWEEEKKTIREEEEKRAIKIAENNKRETIRSSERIRAERKAGVTSYLDVLNQFENTPKRKQSSLCKTVKKRKSSISSNNNPKKSNNVFGDSGAEDIIFGNSSSNVKRKKRTESTDRFEDFRAFDDI